MAGVGACPKAAGSMWGATVIWVGPLRSREPTSSPDLSTFPGSTSTPELSTFGGTPSPSTSHEGTTRPPTPAQLLGVLLPHISLGYQHGWEVIERWY